ncbi:hypothetical protein [Bosea sp. (in: a-proteobacteria)]|uniref:hypothetical protein n=1 Tax=Bosea sp. (in: a-proteobacteria) TaxID=1871050 RepID=UPI0027356CCA|nr:hypothetical protein [Bosea sp. (in: a-proteobacteria)]MDP3407267.1 hypothetical protein [Bosea sp. (in: a-proteobacteria)]
MGDALDRAADDGPAEAELQRQADERRRAAREAGREPGLIKATRALFIDALYRAKALNGDAAFDIDDLDDLDTVEGMAQRLTERRHARAGVGT